VLWGATGHPLEEIAVSVPCELRPTYRYASYCSSTPGHPENPLTKIKELCNEEDYCVFKLDIDTPTVELAIINQLLEDEDALRLVDEMFFEFHGKAKHLVPEAYICKNFEFSHR
jgi:hypothetical protein